MILNGIAQLFRWLDPPNSMIPSISPLALPAILWQTVSTGNGTTEKTWSNRQELQTMVEVVLKYFIIAMHLVFNSGKGGGKNRNTEASFQNLLSCSSEEKQHTLLPEQKSAHFQNDEKYTQHSKLDLSHDSTLPKRASYRHLAEHLVDHGIDVDPRNLPDFSNSNGLDIPIILQGKLHDAIGDFNNTHNHIGWEDAVATGARIIKYGSASADSKPPVYSLQVKRQTFSPIAYVYLQWQASTNGAVFKAERFEIIETRSVLLGAEFLMKTGIFPAEGPNRDRFEKHTNKRERPYGLVGGFIEKDKNLQHVLPIHANGQMLYASFDTGTANFISEKFVRDLGLEIGPIKSQSFKFADGSKLQPLRKVTLNIKIHGGQEPASITEFTVVEAVHGGIILGSNFLHEREILTKNRHFLKVIDKEMKSDYVPGQKYAMPIYLDRQPHDAILDPGHFWGNVMSLEHALKKNFFIDTSYRPDIQLAGGKIERKSEGVVTSHVNLGHLFGAAVPLEFTVVKDWTENITIGYHTIFSTKALSHQYETYRKTQEPEVVGPIFGSSNQLKGSQARLNQAITCARDILDRARWRASDAGTRLVSARSRLDNLDRNLGLPGLERRERKRLEKDQRRQEKVVRDVLEEERRARAEETRAIEELRDVEDNLYNAGIDQ